jgi:hypothetical protein
LYQDEAGPAEKIRPAVNGRPAEESRVNPAEDTRHKTEDKDRSQDACGFFSPVRPGLFL